MDMNFQWKQGFFLVYALLTLVYLLVLSFIPDKILPLAVPLLVFMDPVALGLFFIGGILMLEKSQGVLSVLVVTPLRTSEYLLSKVVSLSIVSLFASAVVAFLSMPGSFNLALFALSVLLSSSFFTLLGIMISAGCRSVNQYFLRMIPYMMLTILPCFSLLGFRYSWLFLMVPSVAALKILLGAFGSISTVESIGLILYLALVNILTFRITLKVLVNKIVYEES